MVFAVSRCRAPCARVAIALLICPAVARAQDVAGAAGTPPTAQPGTTLDPNSPLAPLPGLGVDWPDLAAPDAPLAQMPADATVPPAPAALPTKKNATVDVAGEQRYTIALEGLDKLETEGLRPRFDDLSTLKQGESKPANVAQINRRAGQDATLLAELLRAYGYYDAQVDTRVGDVTGAASTTGPPRLVVTLIAEAGPLYTFSTVDAPGLATTGEERARLDEALAIKAGQPVNADKVTTGIAALKAKLGERGYAFATIGDPDITIDHETQEATLTLPVEPGRVMRFGAYHVTGAKKVFGAGHVAHISRLHSGDRYNATRLDDLRRALIQTGLVSIAQITPRRTASPEIVDLDVHIEPAPPRTIAGSLGYGTGGNLTASSLGYGTGLGSSISALGYGTGQGVTAEIDWTHRNLFPPEGALTVRGVLGTQEQLGSVIFRRNNFRTRDQVLTAQLAVDHLDVPAYEARTVDFITSIERQTNIIWQKKWTYSYGVEFLGSDERDVVQTTGQPRDRTYVVAAIPLSLSYDGSDDLLNPTRGWRLSAHVSPEESLHNAKFTYVRMQLDGSAYQPIGRHVVLAGRLRFGSIQGGSVSEIAPSRRLYSGGGGSVRGFGYQRIGPRDIDNNPVGGASVAEFGAEARLRFGNFGIVPFLDGGNLYSKSLPDFSGFRYGAGLGARYYTSFGPVRLDLGTPINPQPGDARVTVYVSLGQAF